VCCERRRAPGRRPGDATGLRLGIVATRWHDELTHSLLERARIAAAESGVTDIVEARVVGAIELAVVAQAMARKATRWSRSAWSYVAGHRISSTSATRSRPV